MNIDFHTHGKLAKKLPFSTQYTDQMFHKAYLKGLDAICLTEHFNTLSFLEMYDYIYTHDTHVGDCCQSKEGLLIFFGMEIDIKEGGHTLVIGRYHDIVELNKKLEKHKAKESFLTFDELVTLVRQYDVIFGGAHVYRQGGHIPELSQKQLLCFDFFDLNGKDLACYGLKMQDMIYQFAHRYHKPVVSGSDTHQATQYGCVQTCFQSCFHSIKQLREEIDKGQYTIQISESLNIQVEDAILQKRLLKEVYRLGGDYVALL